MSLQASSIRTIPHRNLVTLTRTPHSIRRLQTTSKRNAHPPKRANLDTSTPHDLHSKKSDNINSSNSNASNSRTPRGRPSMIPSGVLGMGPVTLTLVMLLLSGVGWFGYRYYRLESIYPKPIRAALKVGIAAMLKHEYEQAEMAFRRALEIAYATPPSELSPDPLLKLTGIAIKLSEALELSNKKSQALTNYIQTLSDLYPQFDVYPSNNNNNASQGFMTFDSTGVLDKQMNKERRHPDWKTVEINGRARLRAVGMANRAAMLAEGLAGTRVPVPIARAESASDVEWTKSWSEMELFLRTFSVTQVLYLASNTTGISTIELATSPELDFKLPKWLTRLDLAAPCEGLAECYVRRGEIELALPLYQTTYHLLLPSSNANPTPTNISTTTALESLSTTPSDPTTMCMAAGVLTAMCAAVMGLDSPRRLMGLSPSSTSAGAGSTSSSSNGADASIVALRSWARESRRLVDLGRRIHGKADYLDLMRGVEVLGREDTSKHSAKPTFKDRSNGKAESKEKVQPEPVSDESTMETFDPSLDKDQRLVRLDLKRIQEGNRRWKEAAFKAKVDAAAGFKPNGDSSSEQGGGRGEIRWGDEPGMKGSPICERTWAVVLYNTGMIEAYDGNTSIAEQYLQLALEQSRRINLLEGVERSKSALKDLMSGSKRR